ncbi:MAG: 2-hydroxyacyl-CoA dehydratase [Chloroflexi bacterium]|nr:2-hydroxyacyl-CoA dehydratase [Chloroflexota bacterium]
MALITERPIAADALRQAYVARLDLARDAQHAGTRVVGLVGNTIPRELVLACGRLPVLVAAERGRPTPHADVFMEDVIPPETRALFERAARGDLEFLDLLVLSRPYGHLYYYLKEVHRLGRGPLFPPLHMFDLMQSQRQSVRAYNWNRFQTLIERLERLSGEELSERRLLQAIELTNAIRKLQRELLDLRWQGRLSGVDALQALGAGYLMPPHEYRDALETYLQTVDSTRGGPRLLIVTSEPLSHTELHRALESAGALVVAEDDWWGSRAPGANVPFAGSAREAIFQKYWLDTASSSVYPATAREAWLRQHALRPEVDGVVFYLPPSDHQLGWDYPRLNAWLSGSGKPTLLVRADATIPQSFDSIRFQAERFLESLT